MKLRRAVSRAPAGTTFPSMSGGVAIPVARIDTVTSAVAAAVAGQQAGWDALFDRFYPTVLRFAMARLGDPTAAEEVAQEVFVAAVGSLRSLRDRREPAVEAWFLRITRHKAVDHLRRRPSPADEVPEEHPAADNPAEEAALRLQGQEVRRAMEVLTEDQREVLIRRFVLDQSLEQVAEATRRRVGSVKSMQHRALAMLAKHMPGAEQS